MTTFLRLELARDSRDGRPADTILVNIDHIRLIRPTWPSGCAIVTDDDSAPSIHVRASFDDITKRLIATGGRVMVKPIDHNDHVDKNYEAARADLLP